MMTTGTGNDIGNRRNRRNRRNRQSRLDSTIPDFFEQIRMENKDTVRRVNNADVITTKDGEELGFCHIAAFLSFNEGKGRSIKGFGAILLAIKHLNNGDGYVVPEVEGLDKRCNIRFTTEMFDTESSIYESVHKLVNVLARTPGIDQLPSIILGPSRSSIATPMSILSGISGYPQLCHECTSTQLDDKDQYKLFGRLITSDDGTAYPLIHYLNTELGVNHVAIVHVNDAYGNAYARSIQSVATEVAPDMNLKFVDIASNPTRKNVKDVVTFLKSTNYRYFYGIVWNDIYLMLMEEAFASNIAGSDHFWMFTDGLEADFILEKEFDENSSIARTTQGISILKATSGLPGMLAYDAFVRSWSTLNNDDDIQYIKTKLVNKTTADINVRKYLSSFDPEVSSAFLYDSTIAIGLAACNATDSKIYFNGSMHYQSILETSFEGATGNVSLDKNTGSRDPKSSIFELTNFVRERSSNGKVKFTSKRSGIFRDGEWIELSPYIFNDGSSQAPIQLPHTHVDMNYIGTLLRATGLVMSTFILVISIGFAIWTYWYRNTLVVRASQPLFLFIICFGTLLMGSSIIPFSFDDEMYTEESCSIACIVRYWLFYLGWAVAFSGLFSKTRRVNKIFYSPSIRHIQVKPIDVMIPMIVLLFVDTVILALWTALFPRQWTRIDTVWDEFGRTVESRGFCSSTGDTLFQTCLLLFNLGALLFALYQAFVARKISFEFAESTHVFLAMTSILLVSFVTIPIIVLVTDETAAKYFVHVSFIFTVCVSLLLLLFVPKINYLLESKKNSRRERRTNPIPSPHNPTRIANSQIFSEEFINEVLDGAVVTDHPREREDLAAKVSRLLAENRLLRCRLARTSDVTKLEEISRLFGSENIKMELSTEHITDNMNDSTPNIPIRCATESISLDTSVSQEGGSQKGTKKHHIKDNLNDDSPMIPLQFPTKNASRGASTAKSKPDNDRRNDNLPSMPHRKSTLHSSSTSSQHGNQY